MGFAAGIVIAAAVPVGALAWIWARRAKQTLCPQWRSPTPRWTGLEVILLFLLFNVLPGVTGLVLTEIGFYRAVLPPRALAVPTAGFVAVAGGAAAEVDPDAIPSRVRKGMWAGFLAIPLLLFTARMLRSAAGRDDPPSAPTLPPAAAMAVGVAAWIVLTPIVFAVYLLTQVVVLPPGEKPDTHPLVVLGAADRPVDVVVFLLSTCVFVPLGEEFIFRGVFVPWAARVRYGPILLFAAAVVFAAGESSTPEGMRYGPLVFVAVLGSGLALIYRVGRMSHQPFRIPAAVYSSAAFFAAVHSNVWPTPVPLFVLGLGLGYLVARTRRVLPAVIVHGLFNAVSAVLVLSGGAAG
jgi:membrane protease YdiL (CAAX protease family)